MVCTYQYTYIFMSSKKLPKRQRLIPRLISAVVKQVEKKGLFMKKLNVGSFMKEHAKSFVPHTRIERMLQWWMRQKDGERVLISHFSEHLDDEEKSLYSFMDSIRDNDMRYVFFVKLYRGYIVLLKKLGLDTTWQSEQDRMRDENTWFNRLFNNLEFPQPDNFLSKEGIEWYCNHFDILDLLQKDHQGHFVIDTTFLDNYEYKDWAAPLGARLTMEATPDGFSAKELYYQGKEGFGEEEIRACLAGILTYTTICSHLFHVHYRVAYRMAKQNQVLLSLHHPIRRVLLPTELEVSNNVARAISGLIRRQGAVISIVNFTYAGAGKMITDYKQGRSLETDIHTMKDFAQSFNLTPQEKQCPPFSSYITWKSYLLSMFRKIVGDLYSSDREVKQDKALQTWYQHVTMPLTVYESGQGKNIPIQPVGREEVAGLLAYVYFCQVRHSQQSNDPLMHFGHHVPFTVRRSPKGSHSSLTQSFLQNLTFLATSTPWLQMTTNMSKLMRDAEWDEERKQKAEATWNQFYKELWELPIDPRFPLLTPREIEASSGL